MLKEIVNLFKSIWSEDCLDEETAKACGLTKYKKDLISRSQKMDKSWLKDATDRFFLCEYKGGAINTWGDTSTLFTKVKARTAESKVVPIPKWPYSKFACNDRTCKGCRKRCKTCLLCEINKMQETGRSQSAKSKKCTSPQFPCMKSHCIRPLAYPEKQKKTQSPTDYGSKSLKTLLEQIFFVPPLLDFAIPDTTLDCDKPEYLVFLHGFFASLFISANKWGLFQTSVKKMIAGGTKRFCTWIIDSIRKCENNYGFNHTRWSEAHALYQKQIIEILNVFPQTTILRSGFNMTCAVSFNATAALLHPQIGWNTKNIKIPLVGTMYENCYSEIFSCRNSLAQPFVKPLDVDSDSSDEHNIAPTLN